jgi:flagellar biogenesis protein FliO
VKHKFFRALLFALFASISSASAEPVATASNGFLSAANATTEQKQSFVSDYPAAATSTPASAAEAPLPFYLEGPVASITYLPTSDPLSSTLRIVSSLFAVIILAFALSWFIQKKTGFGGNVFGKVLGVLPLDNRRMIYLVDVMGKVLILGVTDSNINMLGEVTDKDTLDSLRLQNDKPMPGMERLFAFLRPTADHSQTSLGEEDQQSQGKAQTDRNHERMRKLNELLVKRNNTPEN